MRRVKNKRVESPTSRKNLYDRLASTTRSYRNLSAKPREPKKVGEI